MVVFACGTDEDISISPELLLPYQVVSDIAAQACMLRHQCVIHQVYSLIVNNILLYLVLHLKVQQSNLVQLVSIMDKHVIDSKHLFLHSVSPYLLLGCIVEYHLCKSIK